MAKTSPAIFVKSALLIGAAWSLGACGSTTYGTGTTVAAQTIKDVTGILSLRGGGSSEPINYEPRPPIVEPPTTALPPPGSDISKTVAAAGNWPVDPDEEKKRIEAMVEERTEAGESLKFTVPESGRPKPSPKTEYSSLGDRYHQERLANSINSNSSKDTKKMFADAKQAKVGSFDEYGNPVRKYLIEPPATYREPDPESPVEVTEKPKKKRKFKLWPF